MHLSDDRINHLSHLILKAIKGDLEIADESMALRSIKNGFHAYQDIEAQVDKKVRLKIASLKRGVPEGSREWDILYHQYFDEELSKLGLA